MTNIDKCPQKDSSRVGLSFEKKSATVPHRLFCANGYKVIRWKKLESHTMLETDLRTVNDFLGNRVSYMSAHVLLNLLDELRKSDKMRGLPSILSQLV